MQGVRQRCFADATGAIEVDGDCVDWDLGEAGRDGVKEGVDGGLHGRCGR